MGILKYKQRNNSSKKNKTSKRNNTRRNKDHSLCKKGETDESIRIRKLTEFVELNNQMYDALNKKYEELQQTGNDKKNDKNT